MARRDFPLLVLSVLTSATGELINQNLDQQLLALNALNTRNELGLLDLSPGSAGGYNFSRGVLFGLNTLERRGNATSSSDSYSLVLGLRQLRLAFALVTGPECETSAGFSLPGNRLLFRFTVLREPECRAMIDELLFTESGPVEMETSELVGEPSRLQQAVLPFINSKLDQQRDTILANLQAICWDIE